MQDTIDTVERLRTILAERGYFIGDVAEAYRRHVSDFLAICKTDARDFAVVRAARVYVVVRPYGIKSNRLIRVLRAYRGRLPAPTMYAMPPLPLVENCVWPWRHFATNETRAELALLLAQ